MAQPVGFFSQDNRTDMGIPVFWTSESSDPPRNFKIWYDQFLLAVTVKENVNPEVLLGDPKAVVREPMPRPETEPIRTHKLLRIEKRETKHKGTKSYLKMRKEGSGDERWDTMCSTTKSENESLRDYFLNGRKKEVCS